MNNPDNTVAAAADSDKLASYSSEAASIGSSASSTAAAEHDGAGHDAAILAVEREGKLPVEAGTEMTSVGKQMPTDSCRRREESVINRRISDVDVVVVSTGFDKLGAASSDVGGRIVSDQVSLGDGAQQQNVTDKDIQEAFKMLTQVSDRQENHLCLTVSDIKLEGI